MLRRADYKCINCSRKQRANWHKNNKDKVHEQHKRYYQKHQDRVLKKVRKYRLDNLDKVKRYQLSPSVRYNTYKSSAKTRDIPFELTFEQFKLFWQKPCKYGCTIDTIGLDRIDSSKGYTLDNVISCCATHNKMKLAMTEHK